MVVVSSSVVSVSSSVSVSFTVLCCFVTRSFRFFCFCSRHLANSPGLLCALDSLGAGAVLYWRHGAGSSSAMPSAGRGFSIAQTLGAGGCSVRNTLMTALHFPFLGVMRIPPCLCSVLERLLRAGRLVLGASEALLLSEQKALHCFNGSGSGVRFWFRFGCWRFLLVLWFALRNPHTLIYLLRHTLLRTIRSLWYASRSRQLQETR